MCMSDQMYLLRVGPATKLPYPVLLGQSLQVLPELVNRTAWCGFVTRAMAREQQQADMSELPFNGEEVGREPTCTREERCER